MENISISLSESDQDKVSEVRVDGVIDTTTAGELEEVIDSLLKRDRYRIVLDLAGVDYISSAGWGIFISHIKEVRANGGDIKLANMITNVYEIYELLEFDKVLKVYNSVDAARDDFQAASPRQAVKKKSQQITRLTVVDTLEPSSSGNGEQQRLSPDGLIDPVSADLETIVLRIVGEDPFASIWEMKREANRLPHLSPVGWWQVFSILKKQGLLTKRSRFKLVRRQRQPTFFS